MPLIDSVARQQWTVNSQDPTFVLFDQPGRMGKVEVFVQRGSVVIHHGQAGSLNSLPVFAGGSAVVAGEKVVVRYHSQGSAEGYAHVDMGDRKPKVVTWTVLPAGELSETTLYDDRTPHPFGNEVYATVYVDSGSVIIRDGLNAQRQNPACSPGDRWQAKGNTIQIAFSSGGDPAYGTAIIHEDEDITACGD